MYRIAVCLISMIGVVWPTLLVASEEEHPPQPSARERLNQVLDSEGGTTVYMDPKGNVESAINLPDGQRVITVQPPQAPGMNLGPPLQLNNRILQFTPPPPTPAKPPAPEYPQRAR